MKKTLTLIYGTDTILLLIRLNLFHSSEIIVDGVLREMGFNFRRKSESKGKNLAFSSCLQGSQTLGKL